MANPMFLGSLPDLLRTRVHPAGPTLTSADGLPHLDSLFTQSLVLYPTPPCLHPSSWFILFQTPPSLGILHYFAYVFPDFDLNTIHILSVSTSS